MNSSLSPGENIAYNLETVRALIADAARRAGRAPADVKLIAVSKTQSLEAVRAAIGAGQLRFGENTLQDALTKLPHCQAPDIEWHFIGHLQSNKAKAVAQHFHWLHSLDSLALARKLAAGLSGTTLSVLIEVNIASDPRKHGVPPAALPALMEELLAADLQALKLRGLMAIGPQDADEPTLRRRFAQVRELALECQQRFPLRDFDQLSMGMSGDFVPAILEGATYVRIGTALFGRRPPPNRGER